MAPFCLTPEVYTLEGSEQAHIPVTKVEKQSPWVRDSSDCMFLQDTVFGDQAQMTLPQHFQSTSTVPFGQEVWSTMSSPANATTESISDLPHYNSDPSLERPSDQLLESNEDEVGVVARIRAKRRTTTKETANYECYICGRLFERKYNHRQHMDTHDPKRELPNTCSFDGCAKKFVRKTDLARHEMSVHLKSKEYKCPFCEAQFARKDTLR
ncbi:hypothetical protein LTR04_005459, partial [Oleoguttula sp. CCFEE 6159]